MEIFFKLKMVSMPNFINFEMPPRPRQEVFTHGANSIPIEQLSEEQARQYAEEMRLSFIAHWKNKKSK